MHELILWAGFSGAWLLVAGPLFQGAVELRAEDWERSGFVDADAAPTHEPLSGWWWFLPLVMYVLRRRQAARDLQAAHAHVSAEQKAQFSAWRNKAAGWFTVSAGALLIAAKETWELNEHYHWPETAYWFVMIGMAAVCSGSTAIRMIRSQRLDYRPASFSSDGSSPR